MLFAVVTGIAFAQDVKTEKDGFKWIPFLEYGRIGAKSASGKLLVPTKYYSCYYERGHFAVEDNMGHKGVVSTSGKVLVPAEYSTIMEVPGMQGTSPYVVVNKKGWGAYSCDGKILIPVGYLSIEVFTTSKGLYFSVKGRDGYNGIADEKGNWIINPSKSKYQGFIVKEVKGEVYFAYMIFGEDRCSGVLDSKGREVRSTHYTVTWPMEDKNGNLCFSIQHGFSLGEMDIEGNVTKMPVTSKSYNLKAFGDKVLYIVVDENGLWGIADKAKEMKIPCKYDYINLTYPYFSVKEGQYMGLFDEQYKEIVSISDKYVTAAKVKMKNATENYICAVTSEYKSALYTTEGKKLSEAKYDHINFHIFNTNDGRKDTVLIYDENGLWGCETLQHDNIFPPRYHDLNFLETPIGNYYHVFLNGLVGLCDSKGVEIISPLYTGIDFKRAKNKDYFLASNGEFIAVFNTDGTQLINGETFSYIWYNQETSQFIATHGKRRCTFSKDGTLLTDNALNIERDKYIDLADAYFEKKKYKSAAKHYGLAIDIEPSASLYFNRGVSYYNTSNYYDAIADFRRCLDNNPSKSLMARALELMDNAEEYQLQKEQRNEQIGQAIFGLVLTGANMYFQAQAKKQRTKYTSRGSSSTNSSDYSEDDEYSGGTTSTSSSSRNCPSLKVARGKWYCCNTGECGMCNGDGLMASTIGGLGEQLKCTLCGGSGKCKYCQ